MSTNTSTATVLYEASTTNSTSWHSTPANTNNTISILIHPPRRSNKKQGPSPFSVVMRSDQENSCAEQHKSIHSASSAIASCEACSSAYYYHSCTNNSPLGCMDEETRDAIAASTTGTTEDDEEVEPFRRFLLKSPMISLRRVGQDSESAKKPSSSQVKGATPRFGVLDRTTSAPIPKTEGNQKLNTKSCRRRSLFDAFWESSSLKQKERFHMPRRYSLDVLEASFPHHPPRAELAGKYESLRMRSKDDYASTAYNISFLPSVPAPLERLLSRSSGVYPLFEPKSILKKKEPRHDDGSEESSLSPSSLGVRLKQTLTKLSTTSEGSNNTAEDNATDTMCTSSSSTFKAVHFDPRVVVTEVHDPIPRSWYSEQELQTFQSETVKLAKEYLQMHPELVPLYSKPFYDPILKKMRRKPLFALKGLSELEISPKNLPVKRILVVDPNDKFQSLLCRSLQIIFPAAEMVRTHNGLAALEMLKKEDFDIAICQERLSHKKNSCFPPRGDGGEEVDSSSALFSKYQREAEKKWQRTLLISISPYIGKEVEERSIVGNGATDFVWGLPPPKMDLGLQRTLVVALDKKRAR